MPSSQDIFGFHADPNHFQNAFGKSQRERDAAMAEDNEAQRIQGLKETASLRMPTYGMDGIPGSMMGAQSQDTIDRMVKESHDENIRQGGDGSGRGTAATAKPYRGRIGTSGDNMASQPGWWTQATSQGPFRPAMDGYQMAMQGLMKANG